MNLKQQLTDTAKAAQSASRFMLTLSSAAKNKALKSMALALLKAKKDILAANKKDIAKAKGPKANKALIDRLSLNSKRIKAMADSLIELTKLHDPVGEVIKAWRIPNGLRIHKVRVPIGVIAIIYESRPDVTSDCIGLCFKSGNAVILRAGREARNSNLAIFSALQEVIKKYKIPAAVANIVPTTDRRAVDLLLKLDNYIDLAIPRGGEGLIKRVVSVSRIPVIKHYKGICHVYVDEWADLNMAQEVCFNAKVQRPGVCNAMESMLVHRDVAARFLPGMLKQFQEAGVKIRGCSLTQKIASRIKPALKHLGWVTQATDKDYRTEYLDLVLSVKVVENLGEAISHINNYGSRHSEAIITENYENALQFLRQVDSACVYVNASTRFTDGHQFGMGAEIGISTDKLHARGPMALEELTTYKYMVFGNGQVRR